MPLGRQFEQLSMFVRGRDLRANYESWPGERDEVDDSQKDPEWTNSGHPREMTEEGMPSESDHELWDRKYKEGKENGLHADLARNGVQQPIPLGRGQLLGGHHRAAWAAQDAPDAEIPVTHIKGGQFSHPTMTNAKTQMDRHYGGY